MVARVRDLRKGDIFKMYGREYKVQRVDEEKIYCFRVLETRDTNYFTLGAKSQQFIEILHKKNNNHE